MTEQPRLIGARLWEARGQLLVYDNRPGAGGRIGFELLAQTPPDCFTISCGSIYESNSWQGIVTCAGTPGQIVARLPIRSEMEKWGKVIKTAGVSGE